MSINLGIAVAILIFSLAYPSLLASMNPLGADQQELFITLLLVLAFAVCVEVPGFILNVKYDKGKEEALQYISDVLLDVRLSPTSGNRERLRDAAQARQPILEEGRLGTLISKCAEQFVILPNADNSLLNVLIEVVRREQTKASERSKHPFPVLVQLLSLSGLAFVLGEMLSLMRGK